MQRETVNTYSWEVRCVDIDPDTGKESKPVTVAIVKRREYLNVVLDAITNADDEPNREYFATQVVNTTITDYLPNKL
jgi:hypothetical protein